VQGEGVVSRKIKVGNLMGGSCPLEVQAFARCARRLQKTDYIERHRLDSCIRAELYRRGWNTDWDFAHIWKDERMAASALIAEIWKDRVLAPEQIETIVEDDRYNGMGLTIAALWWEWKQSGEERRRSIKAEAEKRGWVFWERPDDKVPMAKWDPYEIHVKQAFTFKKEEPPAPISAHDRANIISRYRETLR